MSNFLQAFFWFIQILSVGQWFRMSYISILVNWEWAETNSVWFSWEVKLKYKKLHFIGWAGWHSLTTYSDLKVEFAYSRNGKCTRRFHLAAAQISKTQPFRPFHDIWMTTPHTAPISLKACAHFWEDGCRVGKIEIQCRHPSDQSRFKSVN